MNDKTAKRNDHDEKNLICKINHIKRSLLILTNLEPADIN